MTGPIGDKPLSVMDFMEIGEQKLKHPSFRLARALAELLQGELRWARSQQT